MTATHSTGYRVLVVGFEKALVRHFSVFLKIFEYKVVDTALSVGEAFRKAQANPPDILIVMALLPEMSGVDVGLRISRQSRRSVLFVAAMDTQDFEHTLEQLRGQGSVCMFLPLPFENSDLLDKLKGAVKNQQPHRFKISVYRRPSFSRRIDSNRAKA
jgi:DNA-binding response OmpR family regulator